MAKRDNPDIRYTYLSKQDLQDIDRGKYLEPAWTCTKEMAMYAHSNKVIANNYRIKLNKSTYYCIAGFNTATKTWKTFMVYDKKGCVQKGNLYTIMDFFGIDSKKNYYDVGNIEYNPELFLKIYKAALRHNIVYGGYSPQALADRMLKAALDGEEWVKELLRKPENPIKIICKREGITRPQLARKIGVKPTLLENCISRDNCSKQLIAKLKEYYDYI